MKKKAKKPMRRKPTVSGVVGSITQRETPQPIHPSVFVNDFYKKVSFTDTKTKKVHEGVIKGHDPAPWQKKRGDYYVVEVENKEWVTVPVKEVEFI